MTRRALQIKCNSTSAETRIVAAERVAVNPDNGPNVLKMFLAWIGNY